jgi:hypothetical protein
MHRTVLWPVLARGRPWPARFVHLSRELTVQGGTGVGPTGEHCPGVICQGNGSHDITRLRPTAPGTWPWHLHACLCEFQSGIYAGDRPPSGSGSCQRGRDRGIHRPRSFRPCSELCIPGISWRLQMQNLAHFAILTWPGPPPPPPPFPLKQHES